MRGAFSRHPLLYLLLTLLFLNSTPALSQKERPCQKSYSKKAVKVFDEGALFYKRGDYTTTLTKMDEVLSMEPTYVDAYYVTGLIYYKRYNSNFKIAERNFLKVIELCPEYDPYVYFYLGEIYYGDDRLEPAVKYLKEFVKDVDKIKSEADYDRAIQLLDFSTKFLELLSKPVPFNPQVVEDISTNENEYLAILSPDNQEAFFTREIKLLPDRNSLFNSTRTKEKFMSSTRRDDGTFNEGEEMPVPFNRSDNEGGATLTIDNNTLYYTVCQWTKNNAYYNCDIYTSEKMNGEWGPIRSVSDKVNQVNSWESQPSISPDGKTLYFVSDRLGGIGGYDIYKSLKNDKGEWSHPINLGPVINSKGNEKSPFIHPDGKSLYFSSDGWMGIGKYDIFYSKMDESGSWKKPKNIG